MMANEWDDSKLVFQKVNLQGAEQYFLGTLLKENLDELNKGANQALVMPMSQRIEEKSTRECGVCGGSGKMISCDDCPVAYHVECLGYTKQCPRGKWKCYFCKVTKHGIPSMFPRMAPNEQPVCDILADKCPSWEVKAAQLFDILQESYCAKSFFEPL
jgi:hypothetical protein